jgi:glutamate transport system permease protein
VVYIDVQFPSRFVTAVTALSLYTASFVAEALRSGINSVPPGQAEAARALGLDFGQTLRSIVLPQAFRTVVPPLGNVWIALAKNTSIAAGFAVTDLTAALQRLANVNADQLLAVFAAIVAAYLLITLPSAALIRFIENRVAIVR